MSLREILFAAFLRIDRFRQKGWGELSKALRRPHVLATTRMVRSPFGKEREAKGFVGCREVRLLRSRKLKSFAIPQSMACGEFIVLHADGGVNRQGL